MSDGEDAASKRAAMLDGTAARSAFAAVIAPVRRQLLSAIALSALSVPFAVLALAGLVEVGRRLVDGDAAAAWWWAAIAAASAAAQVVSYNGALRSSHLADARFRYVVRSRLAGHLGVLGLGWFDAGGTGEVKQVLSDDVKRMHILIAHLSIDLAPAVLTPLFGLTYLFVVDWPMALIFTAYLAVAALIVVPASRRGARENGEAFNRSMMNVARATVELGDGIEVVKTYSSRSGLFDRFSRAVDDFILVCTRWLAATGKPVEIVGIMFSPAVLIALLLVLGLAFVGAGWATPMTVVAFLVVGVGVPVSVLHIASMLSVIRSGQQGAAHIRQVLTTPGLPGPAEPRRQTSSRIEFDDVRFGYLPDRPVLEDVSFSVEPGTFTAIVGPSGSGKTTLARLVARFWDVDAGSVRVGDVDVREQEQAALLGSMALVFQDVAVLRDSVRENIRLGRTWVSEEQIVAAAKRAQIHDVIEHLPDGYDTVLDAAGGALSGGEKQRLTIARAIVGEPRIIVLDEATAHVDPYSEVLIQQALAELAAHGATLLVVAHRLHTVAHADQILVLDGGRVAERGTHEELLDRDGLYRRLWQSIEVSA